MTAIGPYSTEAPFHADFELERKSITEDENGDVWLEGYASDFSEDRQSEAFLPGAFERGLRTFLETNPVMLYHHQYDKALGVITEARVDAKGLFMRGRVDAPAKGSWAEDVVRKIVRGTIRSWSVGGVFHRINTPQGPRIHLCDLAEVSCTPLPVNPRARFSVVAAKAFESKAAKAELRETVAALKTMRQTLQAKALADEAAELRAALRGVDRAPLRPTRSAADAQLAALGARPSKTTNHDDNLKAALA